MSATEVSEDSIFKALRKQLLATPNDPNLHYNLGLMYTRRGELDEALGEFSMAVSLKPDMVEAYVNMGGVLLRKGDLEACADVNRKALDINPNFALAHLNLGFAYEQQGDLDQGIGEYLQGAGNPAQSSPGSGESGKSVYDQRRFRQSD